MTPCNLLHWGQHFKGISCSFFRVKLKRVRMQSTYICTLQRRWSLVQSPLPACSGCQQSCYLVVHILPVTKMMWSLITAVFCTFLIHYSYYPGLASTSSVFPWMYQSPSIKYAYITWLPPLSSYNPGKGVRRFLWNAGIHWHQYMMLQPRRPQYRHKRHKLGDSEVKCSSGVQTKTHKLTDDNSRCLIHNVNFRIRLW